MDAPKMDVPMNEGQKIECRVLSVDQTRRRIALGLKQMTDDPWVSEIPSKYEPGQLVKGTVTKITNFGVFIGLGEGLEGLLHISELAEHKVDNPEDVVKVGEELEVKILRVDTEDRKIGLSRKRVDWTGDVEETESKVEDEAPRATPIHAVTPQKDLRGGGGSAGFEVLKQND